MRKSYWFIIIISLIGIFAACGKSPLEDDSENDQPNLEAILKDMVLIPAGEFLMGSPDNEGLSNEHPQRRVYLDAYYIDKYEVTNRQFKEFIDATGRITGAEWKGYGNFWYKKHGSVYRMKTFIGASWNYKIENRMDHPVVQVTWNDAKAYAEWAGKRLPTEAEWEKAARGTDGRQWPWGNEFNLDVGGVTVHANFDSENTVPVGQFPTGVSIYGVYDMVGNAQEWVADWYAPNYLNQILYNPMGPEIGEFRVLRGGSWVTQHSRYLRCALRNPQAPDYFSNVIGFRCALDFISSNER